MQDYQSLVVEEIVFLLLIFRCFTVLHHATVCLRSGSRSGVGLLLSEELQPEGLPG